MGRQTQIFPIALALVLFAGCAQPASGLGPGGGGSGADAGGKGGSDGGPLGDGEDGGASTGDDSGVGGGEVDLAGVDLTGVDLTSGGGGADAGSCVVLTQTGCQAGEKCTLGAGDTTACIVDGTKQTGQACGPSADDCKGGNLCVGEGSSLYQCRAFCASDTDCKQPAVPSGSTNVGHCLAGLQNSTTMICTVPCNPVLTVGASGCASGLGCSLFAFGANSVQGTDCEVPGVGTDGATCNNGNADCAAGYACTDNGTAKKCRKVCRIGQAGTDCAGLSGYACAQPTGTNILYGFCSP